MILSKRPKLCVSLASPDRIAVGKVVKLRREHKIDMVEVRLEPGLREGSIDRNLWSELRRRRVPSIAACHREFRGIVLNERQRINLYEQAIKAGAYAIDIDIDSWQRFRLRLRQLAKSHSCRLILSFHDFKGTPTRRALERVISKARRWGADITKIACLAETLDDCARLLGLLGRPGLKISVVPMGASATWARLIAAELGSAISYCALPGTRPTAAGQPGPDEYFDFKATLKRLRK